MDVFAKHRQMRANWIARNVFGWPHRRSYQIREQAALIAPWGSLTRIVGEMLADTMSRGNAGG